jgi:hypothetical protein
MGDGRWKMGDGRWEMGDGRWKMEDWKELLILKKRKYLYRENFTKKKAVKKKSKKIHN